MPSRSRRASRLTPASRTAWSGSRERDGVLFVNDSKATNPDCAAPALAAYPHIHWIVGGRAKTESLGPCEQHLGHVRAAYTIGEAGPMFARLLRGKVPVTEAEVLEKAVTAAAEAARAGEVVLLSPACASFDQFRDYEARGDAFRAAVEALVVKIGDPAGKRARHAAAPLDEEAAALGRPLGPVARSAAGSGRPTASCCCWSRS